MSDLQRPRAPSSSRPPSAHPPPPSQPPHAPLPPHQLVPPPANLYPLSQTNHNNHISPQIKSEIEDDKNKVNNNHKQITTPTQEKSIQWGSRSVDIFEKIDQIGEGTYGQVYQARSKLNGEIVALKKVRMDNEREGFPITAIREIKILKELDHENVIKLKEIVTSKASDYNRGKGSIYMVFEYMDHDLTGLMDSGLKWFSQAQIKCYMKQLLEGLHYCHKNNVLHRDIKGSNLLINNKGQLKLADFGLARPFNEQVGNYTNRVITLWYRPPELLLGAVNYGPAIDMWSVGCILAELLAKKPIFPGRNEIDQLELIYKLCGTPNEENWPDVVKLPWWKMFMPQKVHKRRIREAFKDFPPEALDLVDRLLCLDPSKRISASEALDSDYFWTEPLPPDPSTLPKYPPSHEFQAKKRRQQQQGPPPPPGQGQGPVQPGPDAKRLKTEPGPIHGQKYPPNPLPPGHGPPNPGHYPPPPLPPGHHPYPPNPGRTGGAPNPHNALPMPPPGTRGPLPPPPSQPPPPHHQHPPGHRPPQPPPPYANGAHPYPPPPPHNQTNLHYPPPHPHNPHHRMHNNMTNPHNPHAQNPHNPHHNTHNPHNPHNAQHAPPAPRPS